VNKTSALLLFFSLLVSAKLLGQSQFSAPLPLLESSASSIEHYDMADLDGDGTLDFVVTRYGGAQGIKFVSIYADNGQGAYPLWMDVSTDERKYIDIKAADLDNDGDQDLIYTVGQAGTDLEKELGIFRNVGFGLFEEEAIPLCCAQR